MATANASSGRAGATGNKLKYLEGADALQFRPIG
jgi:hypothetical protein